MTDLEWCCMGDGGWPFGVALQGEASNRLMLRWLKTVVVNMRKRRRKRCQVGIGKTGVSESLTMLSAAIGSWIWRRHTFGGSPADHRELARGQKPPRAKRQRHRR